MVIGKVIQYPVAHYYYTKVLVCLAAHRK